jgi:hypothetical protein
MSSPNMTRMFGLSVGAVRCCAPSGIAVIISAATPISGFANRITGKAVIELAVSIPSPCIGTIDDPNTGSMDVALVLLAGRLLTEQR